MNEHPRFQQHDLNQAAQTKCPAHGGKPRKPKGSPVGLVGWWGSEDALVWLGPALGVGSDAVHEGGDLGAAGGVVRAEGVVVAAGGYLVGVHPVDCGGVVGVGVDIAESCGGGGLLGLAGLDVAVQ